MYFLFDNVKTFQIYVEDKKVFIFFICIHRCKGFTENIIKGHSIFYSKTLRNIKFI